MHNKWLWCKTKIVLAMMELVMQLYVLGTNIDCRDSGHVQ